MARNGGQPLGPDSGLQPKSCQKPEHLLCSVMRIIREHRACVVNRIKLIFVSWGDLITVW